MVAVYSAPRLPVCIQCIVRSFKRVVRGVERKEVKRKTRA
jgi:hypothetical protein